MSMGMELPYIIGENTAQGTIIMQSFLQQNVLFDAFNGAFNSSLSIGFLNDIAFSAALIGMLILFLSPKLWNIKVVASWTFLFLLIILGAYNGKTFGHDFTHSSHLASLNTDIESLSKTLDCQDNLCDKAAVGDEIVALQHANITQTKSTIASTLVPLTANNIDPSRTYISVESNGTLASIDVYGFKPQVLIMYITNKLRYGLEGALYDLSQKNFSEKAEALGIIQRARTPDKQLDTMAYIFDELCLPNLGLKSSTPDILSAPITDSVLVAKANSIKFTMGSGIAIIDKLSRNQDPKYIPPLMYLRSEPIPMLPSDISHLNNQAILRNAYNENLLDPYFLNDITDDYANIARDFNWIAKIESEFDYKSYDTTVADTTMLRSKFETAAIAHKKILSELGLSLSRSNNGAITEASKVPVDLILATPYLSNAEYLEKVLEAGAKNGEEQDYTRLRQDLIKQGINGEQDLTPISNCGDLMNKFNILIRSRNAAAIASFEDDIAKELEAKTKHITPAAACKGNYYYRGGRSDYEYCMEQAPNLAETFAKTRKAAISDEMKALQLKLNKYAEFNLSCKKSSGDGSCNKVSLDQVAFDAQFKRAMIDNGLGNIKKIINGPVGRINDLRHENDKDFGFKNFSENVGSFMAESFAKALIFAYNIKANAEAGAYSVILPLIKNMVLAFIIVLTPILFLIGLMVPAWAPGVLVTSLIVVFYLQMVDVVQVLVVGVLYRVQEAIKETESMSEGVFDTWTEPYVDLMNTIWAMSYVSSFAITAFLLFAAGNTKMLMGKLTGLDSTVKSTSDQVMYKGIDLTKKAAMITAGTAAAGAGMVTGGTVGGHTGRVAAQKMSSLKAFNERANSIDGDGNRVGYKKAADEKYGTFKSNSNALMDTERSKLQKSKNKFEDDMYSGTLKQDHVNMDGSMKTVSQLEHMEKDVIRDFEHGLAGSKTTEDKANLITAQKLKASSEHAKKVRTENLKSGKNYKPRSIHTESGDHKMVDGLEDKVVGLTKAGADKGWTSNDIGSAHRSIMGQTGNFVKLPTEDNSFQRFKDGSWKSTDDDGNKLTDNGNMEFYEVKDYNKISENMISNGVNEETANAMTNQIIDHRVEDGKDEKGNAKYKYFAVRTDYENSREMRTPDKKSVKSNSVPKDVDTTTADRPKVRVASKLAKKGKGKGRFGRNS